MGGDFSEHDYTPEGREPSGRSLGKLFDKLRGKPPEQTADLYNQLSEATADFAAEAQEAYGVFREDRTAAVGDILDRTASFVKKHPVVTTLLEYVPLGPIPWGIGDVLGMLYATDDLRHGQTVRGVAKLITAIIPVIPTRPIHGVLNRIIPDNPPPENY